jgi:hypothetical protein
MGKATGYLMVAIAVLLVVSSSACIGKKKVQGPPPSYISPCNVVGERVLIKAEGGTLGADMVKRPLAEAFVDDLLSNMAPDAWNSYSITCWWAKNIGEKSGLYYCSGTYVVPDLDENGVITRYIRKEFKIGFEVESRAGVTYVIRGETRHESPYYLLAVKEISSNCRVA